MVIIHYPPPNVRSRQSANRVLIFLFIIAGFVVIACNRQYPPGSSEVPAKPILYPPGNGPFPGVLVLPPAGMPTSAHADDVAQKLVKEGYAAQAISYGEKTSGAVLGDSKRLERLKRLVSDSLRSLQAQPQVDPKRIGIIGYSLGGAFATFLASSTEENGIRAAVIYYGVYSFPDLMPKLRVPMLVFQGDADTYRQFVDQAFAMQRIAQENHRQFDLVIYKDAKHGFDYESSPAFNAPAASDAWQKTIAFLDKNLKLR